VAQGGEGAALPTVFIGDGLAQKLKVGLGDTVRVVAPQTGLDTSVDEKIPTSRDFKVAGIFGSGFDEYDRRLVYVHYKEAQRFYFKHDAVTGVELRLDDIYTSNEVTRELDQKLGGSPFRIIDWKELNKNLFSALRMQKLTLSVVLTFMILVAASNIISALTMVVMAKYREIAILKSMGASSMGILRIFISAGIGVGVVGAPLGIGLGLGVCLSLQRFIKLDPKVYLITGLPIRISWPEMLIAAGVAVALCFVASLLPSWRASRLRPVDGLRYE
jgi:lipoprotein-releasing system permease protein